MEHRFLVLLLGYISSVNCDTDSCSKFTLPANVTILETEQPGTDVFNVSYCGSQAWNMRVISPSYLSRDYFIWYKDQNTYSLTLNKTVDLELIKLIHKDVLEKVEFEFKSTSKIHLSVPVVPVDEFRPRFIMTPYNANVSEGTAVNTTVFSLEGKYEDRDVGDHVRLETAPARIGEFDGSAYFSLVNHSVQVSQELDYETLKIHAQTFFYVGFMIYDTGNKSAQRELKVLVMDVDEPPVFVRSSCSWATSLYPWTDPRCPVSHYTLYLEPTGRVVSLPDNINAIDHDIANNSVQYLLMQEDPDVFENSSCSLELEEGTGHLLAVCNDTDNTTGDFLDFFNTHSDMDFNITIQAMEISTGSLNTTIPAVLHFGPAPVPSTTTQSSVSKKTSNVTITTNVSKTTVPGSTGAAETTEDKLSLKELLIIVIPSVVGGILLAVVIFIVCRSCRGKDEEREYKVGQKKLAQKQEFYAAYGNVGEKGDGTAVDDVTIECSNEGFIGKSELQVNKQKTSTAEHVDY